MTQQNAALVEQSAAAAEGLKDQAVRLTRVVGAFKLGAGHTQTAAAAPAAPTKASFKPAAPAAAGKPSTAPKASTALRPTPQPASPPAPRPAPATPSTAAAHSDDWETF
jgi:methyl-accepting chemotaxis protein